MRWSHIRFRRRRYSDLSVSIREHLQETVDELMAEGMSRDEAEAAARRRFGNVTLIEQHSREVWQWGFLESAWADLRFGARSLRRSPGFAMTAMLTLALGIGAATSVFSVVDTVLLKPFAFRDPKRLIVLREVEEQMGGRKVVAPANYRHYLRLKKDSRTIEDAAIFHQFGASVSPKGDRPRLVGTLTAAPNLLRVLGVQPIFGRDFVPQDAERGAPPVVLLSYDGWQTFFAGASNVVGQTLRLGGAPVTVIGVLPPALRIPHITMAPNIAFEENPQETMLFTPLIPDDRDLQKDDGGFNYKVIARLKPETTLAQARAELEALQEAYTVSARLPIHLGASLTPFASAGMGLVFALVVVRWVGSLLYQTAVMDPVAIGGSLVLLLGTAALAAWMPARRAASVDPMLTLRDE